MKVRTLKRRHDARTLHRWHFLADLRAEMMIEDWQWDDDNEPEGWYACPSCGADTDPDTEDECWHCGEAV